MSSVNDILANQQQVASAIENLYTNFKKDGPSRQSPEYIKKKLDILDSYWFEYESTSAKLSAQDLDPGMRDYINKDMERVSERYGNIRSHIQTCQMTLEDRSKSPVIKPPTFVVPKASGQDSSQAGGSKATYTSSATASKTEEMLRKQSSNFKAFHRTVVGIDLDSVSEKWEFQDLLQTLQSRWKAIDSLHWELDSQMDGPNAEYESTFASYEKKYQAAKKAINKKMWSAAHIEKSTPQMDIPIFNGNYNTWVSFKDLFDETIHNNNSISNAQKMQYLKSKVKGEAERLIQHLHVSSDNYHVCWDILNQRFNNKKLIFTSHMNIMMNLPSMQQQSVGLIKRMHDTTQECLNAIKNLGVDISSWDPIIVYLLTQKLDTTSYTEYVGTVKNPRELPVLQEFLQFLEAKFTALETVRRKQDTHYQKNQAPNKNQNNTIYKPTINYNKSSFTSGKKIVKPTDSYKFDASSSKYKCALCNSDEHGIYFCKQFLDMSPSNRLKTVTKLKLCLNCLYDHHGKPCLSDKVCRECNMVHNRLLHEAFASQSADGEGSSARANRGNDTVTNANAGKSVRTSSHVSLQNDCFEVLLPTALIKIQAEDGSQHIMRALLDQGSQTSLITENAAQLLKIPRKRCMGVITGIGDKENNIKGIISIRCSSVVSDFTFETDVIIMKKLIKNLPSQTFTKPDWSYLDHINMADPEFFKSRPVDILLGADVYSIILMDGICRANSTLPTAQQTRLGWILSGNVKSFQCNVVLHNIEELQKFFEIEDISEPSELSTEDKHCIEFYQKTTTRRQDGRYEVRLPLKTNYQKNLGLSKSKAIAQFYKLEHKFRKNPTVAKDYMQFINEYLSLGHMIPADDCNTKLKCYLPHHCVIREDSTTTKLRVVFNASGKTSSGLSLNDVMFRGPNLQQDLQNLILKWRQYKYALTADIEKMFRQIWINRDDQNLQMILWRDSSSKKLEEYRLATLTYGFRPSPFLAMMTLKQLAHDERPNYSGSLAPSVLEESFYMDDLVHGAHKINSAKQLQADMINLLRAGGFNLRKWKSNSPALLENVNENVEQQETFDFKQVESTKALGLRWNPQEDYFTFHVDRSTTVKPTKRSLLSEISKIFDPLGWLSPFTIKLKILLQDLWKTQVQWDEPIPQKIHDEWNKIQQDIIIINQLRVPRWLQTQEQDQIELFGFCDASLRGISCVIYCKINKNNCPSIILIAGKTKLVPLSKQCSLPRLELCGAVLLSKLMTKIKASLASYDVITYGWIDSMVVLGWINGDVDRWKPFVANRVKQVTLSMPPNCWRYVASKDNPSDCASRGITASQLKDHPLWWEGPSWLPTYSPQNEKQQNYITTQEMKKSKQVNVILSSEHDIVKKLLDKHNSLRKVVRILAWVLRFSKKGCRLNYLSAQELNRSTALIIKNIQRVEFSEEIKHLQEGKSISSKSKLYNLSPILDNNQILRVGGRLRHAHMDPEMKHPIILATNTRLADLIIDQAHELAYHGGARLTTAYIRRKYWLIGGNNATKKRLRLCVKCKKHNPNTQYQVMGDLPSARTNPSRPFYHCGIDYTGHVTIRANKGRGVKTTKGYVAVFVCMATKAVHLELVSDLTTSAFLAALRRMAARRGLPAHIYSDQGKNFIGADKVLKQELSELKQIFNQEFMTEIASMNIEWHFNAPSWPSAGGLWEAAVKSLKHHLRRVIGEQNLTFEEFTTLLASLEGCLNSRPLCPLTEDPDDLNFLTPSHFLSSGPVLTLYNTETDLRTRWHLTQKIFNDIWRRWREEYLTQLTARSKWRKPQTNIKLNDVVIIKDDNLPPGKWALGRVVELHPGPDGYVRVVTLKTKNGRMQRPVVKLSILPVHQDQKPEKTVDENHNPDSQKSEKLYLRKSPRSKNVFSFSYMGMLLFTLFCIVLQSVNGSYNLTPLQGNNSIYFDRVKDMQLIRDEWKLVVYYDTRPYQEGNKAVTKYVKYLDQLCDNVMFEMRSHCDGIMWQIRHEVNELEYYNDILMNHNNNHIRRRRGLINGVGYLANSLFGVLDNHFAEQYEQDIGLIRKNQNHLASLWKNQTSVVEAEFNVLKRTELLIDKHHKLATQKMNVLSNAVNQVKSEIQNVSIISDFLSTAMITNNLIINLKNIQQTLLDAVTNIYNGKFDFHLLAPDQLRRELGIITGELPKDLSLPIKKSDSLSDIYNLLQVRARVTVRFIILEIRVPLIGEEVYEILKLVPIPQPTHNGYEVAVVPVSNYVAVNLKHEIFIKINEEDLKSCLQRNAQLSLCHLRRPIYLIKDDLSFCETLLTPRKCRTSLTLCNNKWMELSKFNTYFYFCCEQCQVKLVCNDQITPVQISSSGFFHVDQGCTIKSADFFVYSHRQEVSQVKVSSSITLPEISQINHIINISFPEISLHNSDTSDLFNHTIQLQEIKRNLEIMKQSEPLLEGKISNHDVHHYATIYILFAIVGLGAAVLVWRFITKRRAVGSPAGATPAAPPLPSPAREAPEAAARSHAPCLPATSTSVQFSELHELPNKSARVPVRKGSFAKVHSARVQVKETGSSPIVFRQGFKTPEEPLYTVIG